MPRFCQVCYKDKPSGDFKINKPEFCNKCVRKGLLSDEQLEEYNKERDKETCFYQGMIHFDIKNNIENCLCDILDGNIRESWIARYLGCSVSEWLDHVKKTHGLVPETGLGAWSFDWVYPLYRFELSKRSELQTVLRYDNIVPVWLAYDNPGISEEAGMSYSYYDKETGVYVYVCGGLSDEEKKTEAKDHSEFLKTEVSYEEYCRFDISDKVIDDTK